MTDPKIVALEQSITKWLDILHNGGEDLGEDNCALCQEYTTSYGCNEPGHECPVFEDTGQRLCQGTPYYEWIDHQDWKHNRNLYTVQCPECERLARKELDYLVDLLVEYRKTTSE